MRTVPADKANHFIVGNCCWIAGAAIFRALGLPAVVGGWGFCVPAAVLREVYNAHYGGKFDMRDIAATLAGGLAANAAYGVA